jgi:hypothetical protein
MKKIKDINIGDLVLSAQNRYKKVLNKFEYTKNSHSEYIIINNIKSTPKHEFLVCDKKDKFNIIDIKSLSKYAYYKSSSELDPEHEYILKFN